MRAIVPPSQAATEASDLGPDAPPEDRYRITLDGIGHSAAVISTEARSVASTVDALNEAFAGITGDGNRESFGGFGLIGLPILATWTAVKKAAEQYVGQRTGQSLKDWMAFVEAASAQFDHYVSVLDDLQVFATGRVTGTSTALDPGDRDRLRDVRHTTVAWKAILGQVSQIGQLVDAILAARTPEEPVVDEPPPDNRSKWASKLQDKVTEAVSQTNLGTAELREWLFRPLVDLRDQVQDLPAAVTRLGDEVTMLEVKLELAIAQLEAGDGSLTDDDLAIMRLRVAGTVLLPGLMAELDQAERARAGVNRHQDRLDQLHTTGEIGDPVHERLAQRYRAELEAVDDRLRALNDELKAWSTEGPQALVGALRWIDGELDLLRGRRLVEEDDAIDRRLDLLETERVRLVSVQQFLQDRTG